MTLPNASARARYVPYYALAMSQDDGQTVAVSDSHPLPVRTLVPASGKAALSGTSSTARIAGPFLPELGRPIWLTLSGTWQGRVRVLRSTDGGATLRPLTAGGEPWANFTANAAEPIAEESVAGASYYLDIAPSSGTVAYEVAQ